MLREEKRRKKWAAPPLPFQALYDSHKPDVVKDAVIYAMNECRPEWSASFKFWIVSLIGLSLNSSVAKYKNSWYRQNNGIPTGWSLCVQVVNIIMSCLSCQGNKVYNKPSMMANVGDVKQFIDDGTAFFFGNEQRFNNWLAAVTQILSPFGLCIDE